MCTMGRHALVYIIIKFGKNDDRTKIDRVLLTRRVILTGKPKYGYNMLIHCFVHSPNLAGIALVDPKSKKSTFLEVYTHKKFPKVEHRYECRTPIDPDRSRSVMIGPFEIHIVLGEKWDNRPSLIWDDRIRSARVSGAWEQWLLRQCVLFVEVLKLGSQQIGNLDSRIFRNDFQNQSYWCSVNVSHGLMQQFLPVCPFNTSQCHRYRQILNVWCARPVSLSRKIYVLKSCRLDPCWFNEVFDRICHLHFPARCRWTIELELAVWDLSQKPIGESQIISPLIAQISLR
jgi:hypothetical protein